MENKTSYRGMLVKVIIESFIEDNLFDSANELKRNLQNNLYSNLKFETDVHVETKNEQTFGKIRFEDENGCTRIMDFTVIGNSLVE